VATADELYRRAEEYEHRCRAGEYATSRRRSQERHARGAVREQVLLISIFFWTLLVTVLITVAINNW
jgi:hypothetical protein